MLDCQFQARYTIASRAFRLLLLTRMFAMTALQAQAIIVGWQVYSLTAALSPKFRKLRVEA